MALLQPADTLLDVRSGKVIINRDPLIVNQVMINQILANEFSATSDQILVSYTIPQLLWRKDFLVQWGLGCED